MICAQKRTQRGEDSQQYSESMQRIYKTNRGHGGRGLATIQRTDAEDIHKKDNGERTRDNTDSGGEGGRFRSKDAPLRFAKAAKAADEDAKDKIAHTN